MNAEIIDRGRGPEIKGTRITLYNIIPYLEDGFSHEEILDILGLTSEQLDAALLYLEEHREELMEEHRRIEERIARGNPPEVEEKLAQTHLRMIQFMEWRAAHKNENGNGSSNSEGGQNILLQFQEWLQAQEKAEGKVP